MSDLVEFLRARLDEDEAAAHAIPAGRWEDACSTTHGYEHVFRWSPDRVLREVEAKRQIVSELTIERTVRKATERSGVYESVIEAQPLDSWEAEVTVKALAAIYYDHPDYRDEWKP